MILIYSLLCVPSICSAVGSKLKGGGGHLYSWYITIKKQLFLDCTFTLCAHNLNICVSHTTLSLSRGLNKTVNFQSGMHLLRMLKVLVCFCSPFEIGIALELFLNKSCDYECNLLM